MATLICQVMSRYLITIEIAKIEVELCGCLTQEFSDTQWPGKTSHF